VKPTTELKYKFDSLQVKTIHYNFIERDGLFTVNTKLNGLVTDLKQVSFIKDNQIVELKSLNNVYTDRLSICNTENNAYKIQIQGLNKSVKQQKFLKTLGAGTTVGLAGYIIIHAIVGK